MNQLNDSFFYEHLLDLTNDAIQVTNEAGRFLYVNEQACQNSGLTREEVLIRKIQDMDATFSAPKAWETFVKDLRNKGQILLQSTLTRSDGTRFPAESRIRYFSKNEQGYIIFVIRDISVRKLQQRLFKKILDELPLSISLQSADGTFNFQNQYSSLNGLGDDNFTQVDEQALNILTDKPVTREELVVSENGENRWFETTRKNFSDEHIVKGLLTLRVDVTQRKQDAEELLRAKKAKEQFLANMSHEIRTPVNGIAGMLNLLVDTSLNTEQKKYLNSISEASRNLRGIVDDILDISAIESGKLTLEHIGFRPDYQIQSAINAFQLQAKEKGIILRHDLSKDAETIVIGDPLRLNQILLNLISNAIKFTYQGEVIVKASLLPKSETEIWMEYSVSDTGIGIAPEKHSLIFDSFQQAEESTSRQYGGTGLGLAICKQLVTLQKGSIEVKSKPGTGTIFRFTLPYPLGNEISPIHGHQPEKENNQTKFAVLAGLRILLVEDNNINRIYAKNTLKKVSCQVDYAENGLIALEKIRKNLYDVILMDVQMPVMDGFEATRSLRTNFTPPKSQIPVIALTANAIKGDNERCLEVGMNHYISKPFDPEQLYEILLRFVPDFTPLTLMKSKNINQHEPGETSLKSIIDLSYLSSLCGGDTDFMNTIIDSFITDVPDTLQLLMQQVAEAKWSEASKSAHQIKPSLQFVGLQKTLESIRNVELYCKQESNLPEIPSMVSEIENEIQSAIIALKEISPL